jgi:hypothetical protein
MAQTPATVRPALDIAALNEFLEMVGSYTTEHIFNPGDLLAIHHYTDLNGLRGIVEDHDLWLTCSRYSNDEDEIRHGLQIVDQVIKERLAAKPEPAPAEKEYLECLAKLFAVPGAAVYVCCFCEAGDLLSQWRGYGANGIGASLGFDPARFSFITGPDSPSGGLVRLWKVFYDENTQRGIVSTAIDHHRDKPGLMVQQRAQQAADAIEFFIPTFKNHAFKEEEEIRLIFTPLSLWTTRPRFRVARGMLVPYYRLTDLTQPAGVSSPPHPLPVTGVCVGPSANKTLNVESVQMLLEKNGYTGITPTSSKAPYRA